MYCMWSGVCEERWGWIQDAKCTVDWRESCVSLRQRYLHLSQCQHELQHEFTSVWWQVTHNGSWRSIALRWVSHKELYTPLLTSFSFVCVWWVLHSSLWKSTDCNSANKLWQRLCCVYFCVSYLICNDVSMFIWSSFWIFYHANIIVMLTYYWQ